MNNDDALSILQQLARSNWLKAYPYFRKALKLGIAALSDKIEQAKGEQP